MSFGMDRGRLVQGKERCVKLSKSSDSCVCFSSPLRLVRAGQKISNPSRVNRGAVKEPSEKRGKC